LGSAATTGGGLGGSGFLGVALARISAGVRGFDGTGAGFGTLLTYCCLFYSFFYKAGLTSESTGFETG